MLCSSAGSGHYETRHPHRTSQAFSQARKEAQKPSDADERDIQPIKPGALLRHILAFTTELATIALPREGRTCHANQTAWNLSLPAYPAGKTATSSRRSSTEATGNAQ